MIEGSNGDPSPRRPRPDHAFLQAALRRADAAGFVHAGRVADPDLEYLIRPESRRGHAAVAYADGEAVAALSPASQAPAFPGEVLSAPRDELASRVVAWLTARLDGGTVLSPRHVPHDLALYVRDRGFDLESTSALRDARAVKSDAELACVDRTARAACRGVERARTVLGAATGDSRLRWEGAPLSTERLRRQVDAALASHGVDPAGHTRVVVGDADAAPTPLVAGEPIRIAVAPRGPAGYHARLARTLVVDGDGGWARRAHVACESARSVALAELAPGVTAAAVGEELRAELAAYGFEPAAGDGVGCGVGLAPREPPSLAADRELAPGTVLSIAPRVTEADAGAVALADTVVVGTEEASVLTDLSTAMTVGDGDSDGDSDADAGT